MRCVTPDWQNTETGLTESLDGYLSLADLSVPGLTILAHPDARRVGERVALPELASGREVRLSRFEPEFTEPGRAGCRPLEELCMSRRPIRLAPTAETGEVMLDGSGTRTVVEADGRGVGGPRIFSAAAVARGVVLRLGHCLVLLLHSMPPVPPEEVPSFGLVGESSGMVRVRREILQAAALGVPVLLRGETGTGKDMVARAVHEAGVRREGPFVAVNMGAIPPALAASELFGAARGAFTGADRKRIGFFQHAHRGTLFLDEIGETPSEAQGLLLRALESGEIQPVGSVDKERVDVRLITATDADLESAIAAGRFRGALYHRLAGYQFRLPALRERRDDVGRLFFHFLYQELRQHGAGAELEGPGRPWPPAKVVACLARYDWPGNVRELRNVVRRLAMARLAGPSARALVTLVEELLNGPVTPTPSTQAPSTAASLSAPQTPPRAARRPRFRKPSEVSEEELLVAVKAHDWRLKPAAAALGISRTTLYRLIESCSRIRKAGDVDRREIEAALAGCSGDLQATATALEVSPHGLRQRMTALGID